MLGNLDLEVPRAADQMHSVIYAFGYSGQTSDPLRKSAAPSNFADMTTEGASVASKLSAFPRSGLASAHASRADEFALRRIWAGHAYG